MLERMDAFFEARLDGYEEHMLKNIESAEVFYPFTASCLPQAPGCSVLDLGCGTGLELAYYFAQNPAANITGIDLSEGMLNALREKYRDYSIHLICSSYFDIPLGEACFDAAVSVESLHHFTKEAKIPLYAKLRDALKPNGFFIHDRCPGAGVFRGIGPPERNTGHYRSCILSLRYATDRAA